MNRTSVPEALDALARRRSVWAALLAGALAVRLAFLLTAPAGIPWSDGRYYEQVGWRLASEHRYTGSQYIGPGYPFFIAGLYSLAGRNLFALRLTQVVLSTLGVALAGVLGSAMLSPAAGLLAMALLAFHPVIAFLPVTQYIEDLLVPVSILLFGGVTLAVRRPSVARAGALGALFGVFMLLKPVVIGFLPGLSLGAAIELRNSGRPRLRYAIVFGLALAAVLAPWTIRNALTEHRFILVSGGAEEFLWMANNDAVTGWEGGPPSVPQWLTDSLAVRPTLLEKNRYYGRLAMDYIRQHPGRAIERYAIRILNLWSPYPRTVTASAYRLPAADWAQGLYSAVLFFGVWLGLGAMMRSGRYAMLLGAGSYLLIAPIFITVLRYRMSFEIVLIWTAALGYERWLGRSRPELSPATR